VIAEALDAVRARIDAAAQRSGRSPRDVSLVAVTKGVEVERIREAVSLGITDIGENRVQELRVKQDALGSGSIRWHMVGTLQKNKVRQVAGKVALIHSVDSPELAETIGARATAEGVTQEILLEVNAARETSKHGVAPDEALDLAAVAARVDGVRVRGFMTIAPASDPGAARAAFSLLRDLRDRARELVPEAIELSMGMTDDFEIAIEEGSTLVRIGTAIFGPRAAAAGGAGKGTATKGRT
jgi:pyridoxal phosphate enzyme (YggS family)